MSNMNCPSAFFTDEPEETMPVSSAPEDLRLLASSEVGYSELWRCREEGKFLILKALKPQYRNVPVYEDLLRKEFSLGYELEHHGRSTPRSRVPDHIVAEPRGICRHCSGRVNDNLRLQ